MVKVPKVTTMSVSCGALPLDFLNTVSQWMPAQGEDYFESDLDFLFWAFTQKQDLEQFSRH